MGENEKARITVYLTPEAKAIVDAKRERDGLGLTGAIEVIIREWARDRQPPPPVAEGTVTP